MVWVNQGLIFDCEEFLLAGEPINYAQSPQAVLFDDLIRVYFCTRIRDSDKTWISKPAFVDFARDFSCVLSEPQFVSIEMPQVGAFDEHGIFPFHPVKTPDGFIAFSTGWSRRQSVDVETAIGLLASSDEGISFDRVGAGPVLTASLNEPFLVCDGWVLNEGNRWRMWYLFGTLWDESNVEAGPQRVYKIGLATSDNGVDWSPSGGKQLIPDVLGPNEAQALPSVRKKAGLYEMVFCFRPHQNFRVPGNVSYQLGYAMSSDGQTWIREDEKISFQKSTFDGEMRCYPSWCSVDSKDFILFNGDNFGRKGFGLAAWNP